MPDQSIPKSVAVLLKSFESCFTAPTHRRFSILVVGWLLCCSRRWVTRVARASGALGDRHHAGFHRFFSEARWKTDDVWKTLVMHLLTYLPKRIDVIVDDTLCRRNGPSIFGTAMHYDGAASSRASKGAAASVACGHAWVVLAVHVPVPWKGPGIAVPILAKLYRSPKTCPESEYRKRSEIARELVEKLYSWLPSDRRINLLGDREYACKTTLRDLHGSIDFTGPMPMDAMLFEPLEEGYTQKRGTKRIKGPRLPSPSDLAAEEPDAWIELKVKIYGRQVTLLIQTLTCLWYTATGTRLIRVVVTRDPKGNYEDRAFFSTRHAASAKTIVEGVGRRWSIEVSFREAKQSLGFSEAQNGWSRGESPDGRPKPGSQPRGHRGRLAVERTAPFALIVRGIIVVWYLGEDRWRQDVGAHKIQAPWYRSKTTPSFDDMLSAIRGEILSHRYLATPPPERTLAEYQRTLQDLGIAA
ncbi:hypothetical protein Poly30_08060 [Planctomycetes bacterium Poly30]|uniref:Transposase IS701-like DDE domain-containing protein n=1 Tax=Saltatorellus ferox TaxID=2528018 RepID=A0A518EMJ5_9BACT|nr:hypothetical protein Poly30_08060 [Planctomycetes bacterium Poly30]